MDARTATFVAEYQRQRDALLAEFPELVEDETALADTLEGMTYAPDLIAQIIRAAREDEAMAEAVGGMARDMNERKQRIAYRANRRREAALAIMSALELRKLEFPDFTASIRNVPPKVEIADEAALPDSLCKFSRLPDKAAIKEALAAGEVPGAYLSNGGASLSIRSK